MPRSFALAVALVVPAALWGLLFVVLPPGRQEFPPNDDWAFARSAFALAHGDGVHYYGWASMPLLGQLAWAAPFVELLGASHVTLRLSTMILALIGLSAFFDLLRREEGLEPRQAAVAVLCLVLNPLFFLLAASFHTDVPALAFSLIALALYSRGLRGDSLVAWTAGMLAALFAVSTRQNAVVVPLVAGLLLMRRSELRWKPLWLAGSLVPLALAVGVDAWFGQRDDVQRLAPRWESLLWLPIVFFVTVHGLGLAALPLLVGRPVRAWKGLILMLFLLVDGALIVHALHTPPHPGLFPYLGDWLTAWGQFLNHTVIPGDRPLLIVRDLQLGLTVLGCVSGALLAACLVERWNADLARRSLPMFTLLHLPFLAISPSVYDRYLLVLLPGALAVAATGAGSRFRWGAQVVGLCLLGTISFALLHDFFAWNGARWELGRRAVARGIDPIDIEGGFQWDGWHSDRAFVQEEPRPPAGLALPVNRRFFAHLSGRYALSFSELPGTQTLDLEPFHLWLIPGDHQFYFVETENAVRSWP